MPTEFLDKSGKKFPFMGSEEEFNKWNKFGFTLVPRTPESESVGSIVPKPSQPIAQEAPQSPITKFNLAIMDMLKGAQGQSGNEDLYSQQIALQRAAIGRQKETTPEDLRQLSPSQQAAIRSGDVSALEPEIDAISAKIKANDSRLRNFESILGQMKEIGEDVAKLSPNQDVIEGYINMIKAGGSPTSIPIEIRNDILAKMTEEDWATWKTATTKVATNQLSAYQQTSLDERNQNQANSIANQFSGEAIVKTYNEVLNKFHSIKNIVASGISGPGDLALVFEFMKSLDPSSVVRESEYDTAAKSGNPFKSLAAKMGGYVSAGQFIPQQVRDDFVRLSSIKLQASTEQYNNIYRLYKDRIDTITGVPGTGEKYLIDYSKAFGGDTQQQTVRDETIAAGYDYDALINQGYTDEDILDSIESLNL